MSGKIIAQIIIGLTSAGTRVFVAAYQQALSNAKRGGAAGAAAGGALNAIRGKMQVGEAKSILNLEDENNIDEKVVEEKFKKMYDINSPDLGGSFYLQSKIFRAKEALFKDLNVEVDNPLENDGKGADSADGEAGNDGDDPKSKN